ncbi:DUF58 domain-containing protein [Marinospirillum perlucidum]|uniref:DUF58 domain-containing protein n=1 Tax=Marinospirillum perlucidum TaxID=1982602 RepID=UPI000DF1D446|nr:DUF58 domain-containing protein [Marinospirillum perlucidum]
MRQPAALSVSLRELRGLQAPAAAMSLQHLLKGRVPAAEGRVINQAGRGLEFHEVRNYQPGDDPRYLDWKVTARRGQAYTRVFADEHQRPVALFVDQTSQLQFGSLASKAVIAARLAALLGWTAVGDKEKVGGWIETDQGSYWQSPRAGSAAYLRWLKRLTECNQQLGSLQALPPGQLDRALKGFMQRLPASSLVIILSDFRNCRDTRLLQQLARRHALLVIQLTDPLDQQLPDLDAAVEIEGEQQPLDASIREAWPQIFREQQARLRQALGRQGRFLEISTRQEQQLPELLLPGYNRKLSANKVR